MTKSIAQYLVPLDAQPSNANASHLSAVCETVTPFIAEPLIVADLRGWIPATELINGMSLDTLFELPQQLWNAPPHAATVLAWKRYARQLAQPLAAAWTMGREIPLLSADNVLMRTSPTAPYIVIGLRRTTTAVLPTSPAARSHGAIVLPDEESQLAFLSKTLIEEHLHPLLDRTMHTRRTSSRTLWGQVAAGFAHGFRGVSATAAEDTARFTALLPMQDLAGIGPDGTIWRNTCCFARTAPGLTACKSCVTVIRRTR